ncbi:hypothetical protein [Pseudoalteromonas denitrificans]|jgi:hypothetical protein|nr:hypothetical protein [Pseudoalteromonas denitrificans]
MIHQKKINKLKTKHLTEKLSKQFAIERPKQILKPLQKLAEIHFSKTTLPLPPVIEKPVSKLEKPIAVEVTAINKSAEVVKLDKKEQAFNQQVTKKQTEQNYQDVLNGKGPAIEIAWPNLTSEREMLFQLLTQCTGMRLGVLNAGNINLVENSHVKNVKLSDFIRLIKGEMTKSEKYQFSSLAAGTPVRLFPLSIDLTLIKKLSQNKKYNQSKIITGQYQVAQGNIWLKNVTYDGVKMNRTRLLWQNDC